MRAAQALLSLTIGLCATFGPCRAQAEPAVAATAQAAAGDGASAVPSEYGAVATASRLARPLVPVPSTVTVLTREEIARNPTLTTDSLLRSVPSVLTFRRSSSLSADPSSQGLNLRGVAPSGVSRTLVLLDGVPFNDPFAGSVYYRALPRLGLSRIEIVPGGGSALYGSSALSGVVQLFSRADEVPSVDADLSYGQANTLALAARAGGTSGPAQGSLEGDWLSSDGFHVVSPEDRGPIDAPAQTLHGTVVARGSVIATRRLTLSSALSLFHEQLRGSTRYTSASAELATASVRADYDARARGNWRLLAFGRLAAFDQTRARVEPGRTGEMLAARQHVPAHDQGLSLTWSRRAERRPVFARAPEGALRAQSGVLLGVDARWVSGLSRERLYPANNTPGSTILREAGGKQLLAGAFGEALHALTSTLLVHGALRVDWVRNDSGRLESQRVHAPDDAVAFAATDRLAVSPRLGLLFEPRDWLRVRAGAYRSFRTPTLNELYRPFQVGTILTAANPQLDPEYLTGAELGVETVSFAALTLRTTGFWNVLQDPIINASLPAPLADGATRARRNLEQARVVGAELALECRLVRRVMALLAYTYVDARVSKQGNLTGLLGKRLAQDPAHRFSALLSFDDPRLFTFSLQLRALGAQYEDDLNTLRMKGYAVVDVLLARQLIWHTELFVAAENLLNQEYLVGRAGVDTIGTPLLARVGLRLRVP